MGYRNVDRIDIRTRRAMETPGTCLEYSVPREVAPTWARGIGIPRPVLATVYTYRTEGLGDIPPITGWQVYVKRPRSTEHRSFGALGAACGYIERALIGYGVPDRSWQRSILRAGGQ